MKTRAFFILAILLIAGSGKAWASACEYEGDCKGVTMEEDLRCKSDSDCASDELCNRDTGVCYKTSSATDCACTDGDKCTNDIAHKMDVGCYCEYKEIPGCREITYTPIKDLSAPYMDPKKVTPTPPAPATPPAKDPPPPATPPKTDKPAAPTPATPTPDTPPVVTEDPSPKESPPDGAVSDTITPVIDEPIFGSEPVDGTCPEDEVMFLNRCISQKRFYSQGGADGDAACTLNPLQKVSADHWPALAFILGGAVLLFIIRPTTKK